MARRRASDEGEVVGQVAGRPLRRRRLNDAGDDASTVHPDAWDSPSVTGRELAGTLVDYVDWLCDLDRHRALDCRVLEELYAGRWVSSDDLLPAVDAYGDMGGDPVRLNFARNAVDFVHTKLCAEMPAVAATSRDGDWGSARRADLLGQFLVGASAELDVPLHLRSAAMAMLRTGTAVLRTRLRLGRPEVEAVPAWLVHVDPAEAMFGLPRSIYERVPTPRAALERAWAHDPEVFQAVREAPGAQDPVFGGLASVPAASPGGRSVDMVDVYRAWSLPEEGPDGEEVPGRHVVVVGTAVLEDRPWTCARLPHAVARLVDPPEGRGFWGHGLLEQLDEPQAEVDFLLGRVSEQIRLQVLKFFVPEDDDVAADHLTDPSQGGVVKYSRALPVAQTPPTMSRESFQHIQWLVEKMYEQAGMSEQAASSQRPAGVNSGRALLFFHDYQTRRFVEGVRRVGRLAVDLAERLIDRAMEASDDGADDGTLSWTAVSRHGGRRRVLDWAKVRMEREEFTLGLEETSPVPTSYAGRMQRIEQLIAQGQVPEDYWSRYLLDPDAHTAERRAQRQADFIEWLLDTLSEVDDPMPPVPDALDLDLALRVLGDETLPLIQGGADPAVMARFGEYLDAAARRRRELQQQQAPAGGGPPAPPPGQGQAGATAPPLSPMGTGGLAPTRPGPTG